MNSAGMPYGNATKVAHYCR